MPDCSLSQAVGNNVRVNNNTLLKSDVWAAASYAAQSNQVSDCRHMAAVIVPASGRAGGAGKQVCQE